MLKDEQLCYMTCLIYYKILKDFPSPFHQQRSKMIFFFFEKNENYVQLKIAISYTDDIHSSITIYAVRVEIEWIGSLMSAWDEMWCWSEIKWMFVSVYCRSMMIRMKKKERKWEKNEIFLCKKGRFDGEFWRLVRGLWRIFMVK